ncbi:Mcd1 protein [Candida orthopsilosis Co 90-125]|uniref:Mcd1 protein n=1 Tax=Candida orthopsilosis (strain 90-125) TaxID=1136231 RepID=H8X5X4_CANO9|nr:Mcd1 protein [Candida orthopsilosis Co 90-125]CCG22888.1 Mcd1 protein [Candida orthopsilosis Co 90-125]
MLSTSLISNNGPLGDIWLAANYDKKLTKHQLLNTNIVKSAKYISNRTRRHDNLTDDASSPTNMDAITLRLSGQLLLGVTKIYSRKTKYLLDDINDVLYKLRAVFRMSSGVQLGPDGISAKVNLPPQQTTIADLDTITLKDQVTGFDLLWQENLQLEEKPINRMDTIFNNDNDNSRFDTSTGSIEYGRFENMNGTGVDEDEDINLDFDLNLDDGGDSFAGSIELGRNASNVGDDTHTSVLGDLHKSNNIFELDLGQPLQNIDDFDVDFDAGYISSSSIVNNEEPPAELQQALLQTRANQRQRRTRITDDGEMVVVNKKLVVDSEDHLQISLDTLRDYQQTALTQKDSGQLSSTRMSNNDKLLLIQQMSLPVASKKRKLWDFSADLHFRIPSEKDDSEDEGEHSNSGDDSDNSIDNSMDDISMSDSESEKEISSKSRKVSEEEEDNDEEESVDESFGADGVENVAKSTKQAADELQDLFRLDTSVKFEDFVEADTIADRPLGLKNKKYVNSKREASRCFFELLVLATNDCINLHQETSDLNIPRTIKITSRDSLFSYV